MTGRELTTDDRDDLVRAVAAALNYWGYDAILGIADRDAAAAIVDTTNAASAPGGLVAVVEKITARAHPTPPATVVEEHVEWGVRWPSGEIGSCGWMPGVSERFARAAMEPRPGVVVQHIAEAVVRRTRTVTPDVVTEWEEVGDE